MFTETSPADRWIVVPEGTGITLGAPALDPDGDPVSHEWFLDDVRIGTLPQVDLAPAQLLPGEYEVRVVASSTNLSAEWNWTIQVDQAPESPEPPGGDSDDLGRWLAVAAFSASVGAVVALLVRRQLTKGK